MSGNGNANNPWSARKAFSVGLAAGLVIWAAVLAIGSIDILPDGISVAFTVLVLIAPAALTIVLRKRLWRVRGALVHALGLSVGVYATTLAATLIFYLWDGVPPEERTLLAFIECHFVYPAMLASWFFALAMSVWGIWRAALYIKGIAVSRWEGDSGRGVGMRRLAIIVLGGFVLLSIAVGLYVYANRPREPRFIEDAVERQFFTRLAALVETRNTDLDAVMSLFLIMPDRPSVVVRGEYDKDWEFNLYLEAGGQRIKASPLREWTRLLSEKLQKENTLSPETVAALYYRIYTLGTFLFFPDTDDPLIMLTSVVIQRRGLDPLKERGLCKFIGLSEKEIDRKIWILNWYAARLVPKDVAEKVYPEDQRERP